MEVFQTDNYYIFVKREKSLWWHRTTSEFQLKAGKCLENVGRVESLFGVSSEKSSWCENVNASGVESVRVSQCGGKSASADGFWCSEDGNGIWSNVRWSGRHE